MICSNTTPKEYLKIHGSLSLSDVEKLVDRLDDLESVERNLPEIKDCIFEAADQLPQEDFLQPILKSLEMVIKEMQTSSNKEDLVDILFRMRSIQDEAVNASEYAMEQLNKVFKLLPENKNEIK